MHKRLFKNLKIRSNSLQKLLHFPRLGAILCLEHLYNQAAIHSLERRYNVDQQRGKYTSAQSPPVTGEEDIEEEEYEDVWPPRLPNSARRYQGLADVRAEVGRAPADVQSLA